MIKQLHKQHYQLHALQSDIIAVIYLQKIFEN